MRNLGDPSFLSKKIDDDESQEGTISIIELHLSNKVHLQAYEELHNNPDKFTVVKEDDHGGRGHTRTVVRYLRKGAWTIELPEASRIPSRGGSKKSSSSKKDPEKKIAGFSPGSAKAKPASAATS